MAADSPDIASIITLLPDGLRLAVKAKPGLSRARPPRLVEIGEGKHALEITVAAVAEDGKANQAILKQLADFLDIRKNALTLKTGNTGRIKLIEIEGDPADLAGRLRAALQSPPP